MVQNFENNLFFHGITPFCRYDTTFWETGELSNNLRDCSLKQEGEDFYIVEVDIKQLQAV